MLVLFTVLVKGIYDNHTGTEIIFYSLGASAFALAIIHIFQSHGVRKLWNKRSNRLYRKFEQDWDGLNQIRAGFWNTVHSAYGRWKGTRSIPNDIEDLIKQAELPAGVFYYTGGIRKFAELEREGGWDASRKELAAFCATFYAHREQSPLNEEELNDFDEKRKRLSKFWDQWGREVYFYGNIKEYDLPEFIAGQTTQILLLVYLEIARAEWNRDEGPGKRWLFKLGKEFLLYDTKVRKKRQFVI